MRRELKEIEICLINLGTGKYNYYTIYDKEDLKDAYNHFEEHFNWMDSDVELQLIDYSYYNLNDDNFNDFLDLIEEYEDVPAQELLYLLKLYTVDSVREILDKGIFYVIIQSDSRIEAFRDYVREFNMLNIPDHLESYINWSAVLSDWECGGLNVERLRGGKFLICDY